MPKAHNNLGNVLRDQGCIDAAIEKYRIAIDLNPEYVGALNNLGNALRFKGLFKEAVHVLGQAININPASAASFCHLGNCFKAQLQLTAAAEHYQKAINLKPDLVEAHFNAAVVHLLSGRFKAGWNEYEWRLQRPEWNEAWAFRNILPRWNGQPLAGRSILVIPEQGFGDTLQFIRYLPDLRACGGKVTLETQEELMDLFRNLSGPDCLAEHRRDGRPDREYDFYVPLLSLPKIFNTTLDTIPNKVPYLFADPAKINSWQPEFKGPALKVGLVWAGRRTHSNNHNRSIQLVYFKDLAQIEGIQLYGLQKGRITQQSTGPVANFNIIHLGERFENFADTAGAIANLDLIISVDTAVVHLAGAMGKPVWLLLPFVPDWRWLLDRQDSPWYPTIRIFRQHRYGDWQTALQKVATCLQNLVAETASAQSCLE